MKGFLILCLFVLSFRANAQVKTIKLLDTRVANVHILYDKMVDLEKNDTLYMVYMGFQNAKYSSITDIKSIAITDSTTFNEFKKDLNTAFKQMETGEKVSMRWDRKEYGLILHDWTSELSLENGEKYSRGYTYLSKKQVLKLITQVSRINLGSDIVLPD